MKFVRGGKDNVLSNHEAELKQEGFIVTVITGASMLPFIRSGRDAVHIKKKEGTVKKGDVVLYKRENGQFVLHRVMAATQQGYTLCGDNEVFLEKGICEEQILGVMEGYFRDNRYIDGRELSYRLFALLWRDIYPARRLVSRLKRGVLSKRTKVCLAWLSEVLGGAKQGLLFLVLLNLFQGFIFPAIALLIKSLIDAAIGGATQKMMYFSGLLLVLVVVQALIHVTNSSLAVSSATNIKKKLRLRTFDSVLKSEYLSVSGYHSGEIVNRIIWDTNCISDTLTNAFPNIVLRITQLSMMLIYLCYLNTWLALAGVVYGGITMGILYISRQKIHQLYGNMRKEEGRLFSFLQEAVANILLVKGANILDVMGEKASLREEVLAGKIHIQQQFSIKVYLVIELMLRLGFVFCIVWCAFSVTQGRLSPGSLTALALMAVQVQSQFLELSQSVTYFISMLAAADRLLELVNLQKEQDNEPYATSQNGQDLYHMMDEIILEDVSYAYDDRLVLDEACLRIKKGDFVAITGMSGIGKSTFMRLLLGVITPVSGKVLLGTITACSATRSLFAFVPQDSSLLSGTVRENITLFCKDADETEIQRALTSSCAQEFVAALSNGLETEIGEHGTGLSAGQVQRLAIARALLSRAPILLLDESTSALDAKTEAQVLNNLKNLKGKTVIAITHREGMLHMFNSHYTLANGRFSESAQ